MAVNVLGSPHMPDLHYLPDLVIDKILQFLPTKTVVQISLLSKQWEGVLSSVLNFDEDDNFDRHSFNRRVKYHKKFMKFLGRYLEYCEKNKKKEVVLDKLRIHMKRYWWRDATIIDRWLEHAFERGVKELDIRPQYIGARHENLVQAYRLPWGTFAKAKSLTSLNLEVVTITDIQWANTQSDERLLPSLKTLSFTKAWFDDKALCSLLLECPSIEYLSLTECSFDKFECHVSSSSLMSLEVKYCRQLQIVQVHEAKNLESFTFVSPPPPNSKCKMVILNKYLSNLKIININVDDLGEFRLKGCHRAVEATINTQNLGFFNFLGHLKARVSVKGACQWGNLAVHEIWNEKFFLSYSSYFSALMNFLKRFGCCKKISLYNQNFNALIIRKTFRKAFSSPLPKSCILEVIMPNPPTEASRDYLDLMDSLRWIAPSAQISIGTVET
ncbi:hypothetical protein M0R45_022522 [Rubus argutus]|uniref:F-box domain-containing protein n=1 Tax=Rubus argutus TaxID=59490 RepID=A0AAW1XFT1_RUBAR